jgi:hypothetical protein
VAENQRLATENIPRKWKNAKNSAKYFLWDRCFSAFALRATADKSAETDGQMERVAAGLQARMSQGRQGVPGGSDPSGPDSGRGRHPAGARGEKATD